MGERSKIRPYFNPRDRANANTRKLRKQRHEWFEVMYHRLEEGESCQYKGSKYVYVKLADGFVEQSVYDIIQKAREHENR